MAARATAAKAPPTPICKPDEHILLCCPECKTPKVAPMELFPYCSAACRKRGKPKN